MIQTTNQKESYDFITQPQMNHRYNYPIINGL